MIAWAGWLIILYGAAHTLGALFVVGAIRHAGVWFTGRLWSEDFAAMSPAGSALWLSLDSFGVPLVLVGATMLWLHKRKIVPPAFVGWSLAVWTLVDGAILLFTPWPLLLLASGLLLIGIHRAKRRGGAVVC